MRYCRRYCQQRRAVAGSVRGVESTDRSTGPGVYSPVGNRPSHRSAR